MLYYVMSLFHLFPGPFSSIKEILAFENNENNDKKLYLHESNKYSIIAKSIHDSELNQFSWLKNSESTSWI